MRTVILSFVFVVATAHAGQKVEILRDEYGVAHIYAATAEGAAYGSGYAQATDRSDQLKRHLASADISVKENVATLAPHLQTILTQFCAGIKAGGIENIESWMVLGYGNHVSIKGSTIKVPPDHTASHVPILIIDPISNFADNLYQLVISSGDYSWAGATPVGLPFPLIGHGFNGSVGPADLSNNSQLLQQTWMKQTGAYDPAPSQGSQSQQAWQMTQAQLAFNNSLTIYDALRIATSDEVYKAGEWQKRIAKADPNSQFAQMITGWSRRSDFNSAPALAFYLFKIALDVDANAIEPAASISDSRIRAAIMKARDQLQTELPFQANYGTVFRIRDPHQPLERTYAVSGGSVAEAGMATPRAIQYQKSGNRMIGIAGQTATQIVELVQPVPKSYMLIPLEGSPEKFARGEVQPTYFGDRKALEKHVRSRKELIAQ